MISRTSGRTVVRAVAIAMAAMMMVLASCSGSDRTAASGARQPPALFSTFITGDARQVEVLADNEGRPVYTYEGDGLLEATCVDACAVTFPPFLFPDIQPSAGDNRLDPGAINLIERDGGGQQVSYKDRALYYFSGDEPRDPRGECSGGRWRLMDLDGNRVPCP